MALVNLFAVLFRFGVVAFVFNRLDGVTRRRIDDHAETEQDGSKGDAAADRAGNVTAEHGGKDGQDHGNDDKEKYLHAANIVTDAVVASFAVPLA